MTAPVAPTGPGSTQPTNIILAIDPGTTGMGFAVLDSAFEPLRLVASGLVPVPVEATAAERLLAIARALDDLIAHHRPVSFALERLYFNKNIRTAMAVAEARGVALLCAARAAIPVSEYTPQEVKQSVTGSGAADKKQVQRMVALILGAEPIKQDNVADAVAIALTHAQRVRFRAAVDRADHPGVKHPAASR